MTTEVIQADVVLRGTVERSRHITHHRRLPHPPDAVVGGLLTLFVVALLLRGVLFAHGWIEYSADFAVNVHRDTELAQWSTAWNPVTGDDNSAQLSMSPPYLILLHFFDSSAAEKTMLCLAYALISCASFWALRSWLRGVMAARWALGGAVLGSLAYTVNPWVAAESVHLYYLVLYGLIPVTFHFIRTAITSRHWSGVLIRSAGAGISTALTMTAYGILFHSLLVAFLLVGFVVAHRPVRHALARGATVILGFGVALVGASAYWLLPIVLGFRSDFSNGTSWALFTTKDIYFLSPFTAVPYALRGMYRDVSEALARMTIPVEALVTVGAVCGFALVVTTLITAFRRPPLGWIGWSLVASTTFFVWLANGTGFPTGDAYALLSGAPPIRGIAYVLLKGPYKLVPMALFGLVFLAARGVAMLLRERRLLRGVGVALAAAMVAWTILLGSPLLTGDLGGYLRPVQPPTSYLNAVAAQAAQVPAGDGNRTVWLPVDSSGTGMPPGWSPQRQLIPLIAGSIPPVASWTTATPLSSRGVTWLGPAAGRMFDEFIQDEILGDPNADIAALLVGAGRREVLVRADGGEASAALAAALASRPNMAIVDRNPWFIVFRAETPMSGGGDLSPQLIVGGLQQTAVESARITPAGAGSLQAVLAADVAQAPTELRQRILGAAREISFAPGKGWQDLVLDTWGGAGLVEPAAPLLKVTVPLSAWDEESTDSHTWVPYRLAQFSGRRFDPALDPAFLVTNQSASLDIPTTGIAGPVDVWARAYLTPDALSVTAAFNGRLLGSASTHVVSSQGWRWVKVSTADVSGVPNLTVTVHGSFSALDRIALVPAGAVEAAVARIQATTSQADVLSGGGWSDLPEHLSPRPADIMSPSQVVAISGEAAIDNGAEAFIAVTGHSHPVSGYWAVGIPVGSVDWRSDRLVTLRVGRDTSAHPSQLGVALRDRWGDVRTYPVLADDQAGTVAIDPTQPYPLASTTQQQQLDLSAISEVDVGVQMALPHQEKLHLALNGIELVSADGSSRDLYVPRAGVYRLMVRSSGDPGIPKVRLDGRQLDFVRTSTGWLASRAVPLKSGYVRVSADLADSSYVVLWQSPAGGGFGLAPAPNLPPVVSTGQDRYGRVGTAAASGDLVILNQPYNSGWVASADAHPVGHLRLNGTVNAFVVPPGVRDVSIQFQPDRWLLPGRAIAASTIAVVVALLCIEAFLRRRRELL